MNLFITTSRGVYNYNLSNNKINQIISNWNKGIFQKPTKGFFGIFLNISKNELIFASREKLSKELIYDKSTDTIIYFYNISKKKITNKIEVKNLFDIHQITFFNNFLFLTETGKNRIQILNTFNGKIEFFINVGVIRDDINHINAINIDKNFLYIGLNNGHIKNDFNNAQIIKIPINEVFKLNSFDALNNNYIINLDGVYHTHDMEKFDDDYLISSSNLGKIYSYNKKKFIIDVKPWTRGITHSSNQIFIGKSGIKNRKLRYSRYYDGEIIVLNKSNFNFVKKILIPKIGQLNDIVYVDD
tara:strand:- start:110 stop:1009 length:900 start_codon:yes stop_codon:yes gene_type:complete